MTNTANEIAERFDVRFERDLGDRLWKTSGTLTRREAKEMARQLESAGIEHVLELDPDDGSFWVHADLT